MQFWFEAIGIPYEELDPLVPPSYQTDLSVLETGSGNTTILSLIYRALALKALASDQQSAPDKAKPKMGSSPKK